MKWQTARVRDTELELEVLALIRFGLSNKKIAERLHVSTSNTKTHVGRHLLKLGAHDRAQLVIAAYEAALHGRRPGAWRPDPKRS